MFKCKPTLQQTREWFIYYSYGVTVNYAGSKIQLNIFFKNRYGDLATSWQWRLGTGFYGSTHKLCWKQHLCMLWVARTVYMIIATNRGSVDRYIGCIGEILKVASFHGDHCCEF